MMKCYNVTMLQCCNDAMLQCYNVEMLQWCNLFLFPISCGCEALWVEDKQRYLWSRWESCTDCSNGSCGTDLIKGPFLIIDVKFNKGVNQSMKLGSSCMRVKFQKVKKKFLSEIYMFTWAKLNVLKIWKWSHMKYHRKNVLPYLQDISLRLQYSSKVNVL